ncbi:hypothetical protein [Bartonella massiliensis]|nr:hypothetical protein [Bartonella massiliensis]
MATGSQNDKIRYNFGNKKTDAKKSDSLVFMYLALDNSDILLVK